MTQTSEQRRYPRYPLWAEVVFERLDPDDAMSAPFAARGITRDISAGGMGISSPQITSAEAANKHMGSKVRLSLNLPDTKDRLFFNAEVVWAQFQERTADRPAQCMLGFEFQNVDEETRAKLKSIIDGLK